MITATKPERLCDDGSPEKKPYFSPSQLDTYCRCPEAWRRRYIEGEKIPPGISMLKGTGMHAGASHNFRQKIETHKDLPVSDIVDAAVAKFEAQVNQGELLLTEEEEGRGAEVVIGEATDVVVELAEAHASEQAPDYQPVLVEEKIRITLPGPRDLLGIVDLADDKKRVVDFKTGAKKKNQGDADNSVQLSVYAAAYQGITGEPPAEVRLDTLITYKRGVERQVLSSDRTEADLQALAHRVNAVTSAIDGGVFPPAPPGAWWCGPKWCGYANTCPYVSFKNKERVR